MDINEILEPEVVLASSRLDLELAQRVAALWTHPHVSDEEAALCVGLPLSSWALVKKQGLVPKPFRLGRRLFYSTAVLRKWLEDQAREAGKTK